MLKKKKQCSAQKEAPKFTSYHSTIRAISSKIETSDGFAVFESTKDTLHYLNLRFMGVGFRGYIIKKIVNVHKLSKEQQKLASRWLDKSEHDGTSFIRVLMLKLGQSALTAYPIPVGVTVYCPTDQQQQADNQPLLLTSTDFKLLTSVAAEIKSYKIPDVYKGSGVFLCERLETEKGEQYLNETTLRKVIKKK